MNTTLTSRAESDVESLTAAPLKHRFAEFSMRFSARRVRLLIADNTGHAKSSHQMQQRLPDRWSLSVRLKPGRYRYRYYADCGAITTYVRPDEVDDAPRQMDGLDAVLIVQPAVLAGETLLFNFAGHRSSRPSHRFGSKTFN